MINLFRFAALGCAVITLQPAAQAAPAGPTLSLSLAVEAAAEAVRACQAAGYRVSVAVIDMAGQSRAQLRGDGSTPHTFETAYRKAYSVITFGPNYGLDSSAQVATMFARNPTLYSAVLTLPGVTPLPGALAIKVKGTYLGAIGVSGAPGGEKDDVCGQAGIQKIMDSLQKQPAS